MRPALAAAGFRIAVDEELSTGSRGIVARAARGLSTAARRCRNLCAEADLECPLRKIACVAIAGKGRGIVATEEIAAGEVVERSPVLPIALADSQCPALNDYSMAWGEVEDDCLPGEECCVGLGYLMLYNHSPRPNITIRRHFAEKEMSMVALRDIAAGEELVYDYDVPLWFAEAV